MLLPLRQVEIRFARPLGSNGLDRVPGVQELRVDDGGRQVHLSFEGSIDPLVKALAAYEVEDLVTNPVDLDEVFLSYYEDDQPTTAVSEGDRGR